MKNISQLIGIDLFDTLVRSAEGPQYQQEILGLCDAQNIDRGTIAPSIYPHRQR